MQFLVENIPQSFRTHEIRNFFYDFIEKGAFKCFHFRHRPEKQFRKYISEGSILSTLENKYISTNDPAEKQGDNPDMENNTNSLIPLLPKSKSHWISSGLGGLSSLITQSKAKAYVETQNKLSVLSNIEDTNKQVSENKNLNKSSEEALKEGYISNTNCCVLEVKPGFESKFMDLYNTKHWIDKNGDLSHTKCVISKLNIEDHPDISLSVSRDSSEFFITSSKIATMIEFLCPSSMPEGNVGTPTSFFRDQIKSCKLPASIISKLGLEFRRSKGKKRFGQVPFDYGTEVCAGKRRNNEGHVVFTAKGHLIPSSANFERNSKKQTRKSSIKKKRPHIELEEEAEEGAELEEWERYETFHDNVTTQERAKERVYEEEIEVLWEKGGSGLNFYTDAQYWREQEGDFDEKTADEWDVDMSGYYEEGAGDFDARTSLSMLESNQLRSGRNISVFKKPLQVEEKHKKKKKIQGPTMPPVIGVFESHTRGFGRRMMESQGWTDGQGLGRKGKGMPYALGNDGQHPQDKMGFGYHGEKWSGFERRKNPIGLLSLLKSESEKRHEETERATRLIVNPDQQQHSQRIKISTVFDDPKKEDPPTPHLRSAEPTKLSHRPNIVFVRSSQE
ncbi:unnamed protein product, partial [Meganyctiphanes norvegica]